MVLPLERPARRGSCRPAPFDPLPTSGFLIGTFKGNLASEQKIYFLHSNSGFSWYEVGHCFAPNGANFRDAALLRHNGKWYMTCQEGSNHIHIYSSTYGIFWTQIATIDCSGTALGSSCGGSRFFVDNDGTVYVTIQDTTATSQSYISHAILPDLSTWSAPALIGGVGFPFPMWEATIRHWGSTYYLFTRQAGFAAFSSNSIDANYTIYQADDWMGIDTTWEGISIIQLDNGKWRLYFDSSSPPDPANGLYYVDSDTTDFWGTWGTPQLCTTPFTARQGQVIKL